MYFVVGGDKCLSTGDWGQEKPLQGWDKCLRQLKNDKLIAITVRRIANDSVLLSLLKSMVLYFMIYDDEVSFLKTSS